MATDAESSRMTTTRAVRTSSCPGPGRHASRGRAELDEQSALAAMRAAGDVVCPRCRDSGYVGSPLIRNATGPLAWRLAGVPVGEIPWCDCARGRSWRAYYAAGMRQAHQERIEATFQRAGIPARFEGLGFDTIPPEHRKGKEQAIAAARQFATQGYVLRPDGKRRPGLALIGRPGVGKTGILSVAFRERLAAGAAGLWIELYAFFGEIQGEYGKEGGDADGKLRAAQRAEVALLDDCGDPDRAKVNPATGEPVTFTAGGNLTAENTEFFISSAPSALMLKISGPAARDATVRENVILSGLIPTSASRRVSSEGSWSRCGDASLWVCHCMR